MRKTVAIRQTALSIWVNLIERTVSDGKQNAVYHSLGQADYINVIALTDGQDLVCVQQYRPAVDGLTLELPGGLLEPDEQPQLCAERELIEETGFRAEAPLIHLGTFQPDTGRLENRQQVYFAPRISPIADWSPEAGVERLLIPFRDFPQLVRSGRMKHMLHLGAIGLAVMMGLLPQLPPQGWQDGTD